MQTNLCPNCIHYFGNLKCFAFPKGIPKEILTGNENHEKPLLNQDNNISFERI